MRPLTPGRGMVETSDSGEESPALALLATQQNNASRSGFMAVTGSLPQISYRSLARSLPDTILRHQLLRSKDGRTGGGVYLWNDEGVARTFMNEKVAPMIR